MSARSHALTTICIAAGTLFCAAVAHSQERKVSSQEAIEGRSVSRRAVEAAIWGIPAVNYDRMLEAAIAVGAGPNQVVFWSKPLTWKNQTLTPNPDTIYFQPFFNTKDGPVVLEIPPGGPGQDGTIVGSVDDCWQTAIEDVGPAGVDKGQGGKYLILPPGHAENIPDGYIPMPSPTFQSYALLRSNYPSATESAIAQAVAYGKRIKVYPLSQTTNPPATKFVDAIDALFDATIPYDASYFESLNRIVQAEPWLERDRAMIDKLKSIGIVKGKPFHPDAAMSKTLVDAMIESKAWLANQYETAYFPPAYYPGGHWHFPAPAEFGKAIQTNYADPNTYPIDERAVTYSLAFFSAKHIGAGQFYLMGFRDKAGQFLNGASHYVLRVPANAPVQQYWSATVYNRDTHTLIRNALRSSRASNSQGLAKNADGSVDVYLGSTAPAGQEANWIPTNPGGTFEVLFRFYGPETPLFDKSWVLPDIERVD